MDIVITVGAEVLSSQEAKIILLVLWEAIDRSGPHDHEVQWSTRISIDRSETPRWQMPAAVMTGDRIELTFSSPHCHRAWLPRARRHEGRRPTCLSSLPHSTPTLKHCVATTSSQGASTCKPANTPALSTRGVTHQGRRAHNVKARTSLLPGPKRNVSDEGVGDFSMITSSHTSKNLRSSPRVAPKKNAAYILMFLSAGFVEMMTPVYPEMHEDVCVV